jgi:uncharacterized protein YqeY
MNPTLKARLTADMKSAMKAGEKNRLRVLRLLLSDIKRVEVDSQRELDEAETLSIVEKALKQRRDSIDQFTKGGRQDLADAEQAELAIIGSYLPEPLTDAELDALIARAIADTGAASVRDMGRVMAAVKSEAAGRADMSAVSARVKSRLA